MIVKKGGRCGFKMAQQMELKWNYKKERRYKNKQTFEKNTRKITETIAFSQTKTV